MSLSAACSRVQETSYDILWRLLCVPFRRQFPRHPMPSYHRTMATALHLDALTLVTRLHRLALCQLAVQLAQRQCPPPLPADPGGAPRL